MRVQRPQPPLPTETAVPTNSKMNTSVPWVAFGLSSSHDFVSTLVPTSAPLVVCSQKAAAPFMVPTVRGERITT